MKLQFTIVTICTFLLYSIPFICYSQTLEKEPLKQIADRMSYEYHPGIIVGLLKEGNIKYYSFGKLKAGEPSNKIDDQTVFEVGSVTKTFTALLLQRLTAEGIVNLEDPINKYLPDSIQLLQKNNKSITLRHLASHTSGLPRLPDNFIPEKQTDPYADYSKEKLYSYLNSYTLTREPGKKYEYSNLGAGLLGLALSNATGKSYEQLVEEYIFSPLKMNRSFMSIPKLPSQNIATGHKIRYPADHWQFDALAGAGAGLSTASDLLKFLQAQMQKVNLPVTKDAKSTHQAIASAGAPTDSIAMGWHIKYINNERYYWHDGGTGGFRSFIGFNPEEQKAVVVLANSDYQVADLGFNILNREYPLAQIKPAVVVEDKILTKYEGTYQVSPVFFIMISKNGKGLMLQATGQDTYPLLAENSTTFFLTAVEATIKFIKDKDGKVDRLILYQNGAQMKAQKVK